MASTEAFTILAVLEAQDRISRVLEQVDASLDQFSSSAARAAETATVAGERIDASLLETASSADASDLASARLSAAQARVAETATAQADAERVLLDAQTQAAAAEDGDAAATERLVAASAALTDAQRQSALASKEAAAAAEQQQAVQRAQAASAGEAAAATDAAAVSSERASGSAAKAAEGGSLMSKGLGLAALAAGAVGVASIKAAGDFQSMTEHLVTDAGESQQNIGMIRAGMLQLATTTGTTTDQMAQGMYHVESAGFHGQQALDVLKTAAEGAKVGGADLDTIGQALTGTMNAFGPSAGTATQMMNGMIAAVGAGDMKMQDFGSSLGNVAAIGASAGLSFAQVAGGVATMTAQNVTAQRATQDLAHTIGSLSNPNNTQLKEMAAMGVNANDLAANLGKRGLTGTFDVLVQAIAAHTQGGQVFVQQLDKSKQAAQEAQAALGQMPDAMRKVAQSWAAGTTSTKDFDKEIQKLPPAQQTLYKQFESLTAKSGSFTDALKANTPSAQTFNAALAKMVGGTTGLNTVLMLTGQHSASFQQNVDTISDAAHKSGTEVDNWSQIQSTFNQKMDTAKASVEAAGISIGTVLLPVVSKIASVVTSVLGPTASWIAQHQKWVGLAVAVAGGIGLMVGAMKAWSIIQAVINGLTAIFAAEETAILSPIELVVIAIAALAAGVYYAWTHFKTFREVVLAVFDAVKTAGVAVWHALETAWNALVTAAVAVGHALETAWNAISGAVSAVGDAITGVWRSVTGFLTRQWDRQVLVAKVFAATLAQAWHQVVSAAEAVWHALETAWRAVANVTSTVWDAITGFFKKWWPLLLVIFTPWIAAIMAIWNHCHKAITDAVVAAWNWITGFLKDIWGGILDVARFAWAAVQVAIITPLTDLWHGIEAIWQLVSGWLSQAWNAIKDAAAYVWQKIKDYAIDVWTGIKIAIIQPIEELWHRIVSIWNTVSGWLSSAWDAIAGTASSVWNSITGAIIGALRSAWQEIVSIVGNIASSIESGLNNAWNAVANIGDQFMQIGSEIVNGIISGVENAGGALFNSLKNLANGALNAAKSFLGISSPSKEFANQVGKWIPAGIAKGVSDNATVAHAAVQRLAGGLPSLVSPGASGLSGQLTGGSRLSFTPSASASGLTINVDLRGSSVMGSGAADQLAQTVGKKIVSQLAAAGHHIRG